MPQSLVSVLEDPTRRKAVIADTVTLIESEVASKSGLRGAAIKAGFKAFTKIQPGIVKAAVSKLLPHFAPAVDPHYAKAAESGDPRGYFTRNADTIAESLLAVTDEKAQGAENNVMKKIYSGLRPQAKQHTAAAMPGLADLIQRHVA
ncbi:MAG: hypothetical protein H6736_19425 [Alphaproteobacteria bacterium]|nr:hypothetical protein [Alphaproteobacteria bacterium]MCB9693983.1 hypothetical protein [Alphaproteobacteria bacterium]